MSTYRNKYGVRRIVQVKVAGDLVWKELGWWKLLSLFVLIPRTPHILKQFVYTKMSLKYELWVGGKNIIYVRMEYLTEFWAQEVWRLLVLSKSWHSWHYHKQTWGEKKLLTHKNILYPTRFRLNLTGSTTARDGLMENLWLLGGCCSLYSHDYSDQVCFFEL